mgnify:CR=1 FL=1
MINYRTSSGCFIFHNENPKGRVSSGDCVIRAIAKTTGKSWEDVLTDLFEVGLKIKDVPNSKRVFQKYLEQQGYQMSLPISSAKEPISLILQITCLA